MKLQEFRKLIREEVREALNEQKLNEAIKSTISVYQITKPLEVESNVTYNVLYDKGTGKTKVTNISNKDGEIKSLKESKQSIKAGDIVQKSYASTDEDYIKEFEVISIDKNGKATLKDTKTGKLTGIHVNDLYKASMNEAPAVNDPKIEKIVKQINDLIASAVDEDGDPIAVIDTSGTWQEPYVYKPIEYKNGALKITSYSVYKQNQPETDIIKKINMELDGIPTLKNIMKLYNKAIKQSKTRP